MQALAHPVINRAPPLFDGVGFQRPAKERVNMDPTMGETAGLGMSGHVSQDHMQADQASNETSAVVQTIEAEVLPPAQEPVAPTTNYPAGVVDFNKPFTVFDAYDDSEIHDDAKVLAVLTGNAYPVVVISVHDGEQVINQFDTDGDDVNGELKAENLETGPRILYGVLIRQGRRDYGLSDELFISEEAARHETTLDHDEVIASVFPVAIPGFEGSAAVVEGISGDVGVEADHDDEEVEEHVGQAANPDARWVNGYLFAPGDKVRARKTGEGFERVCKVIKTREDHRRTLFIQPDQEGYGPYWALSTSDRDTLEHCIGFIRTHFECPECNFDFSEEGDCSIETIERPACQKKFWCREVR